jgi:hypothetical protein
VSTAIQSERLLDVNDLAALPRGRAVLSTSGLPPALVELQHYSTQSYGNDVAASKSVFEGSAANSHDQLVGTACQKPTCNFTGLQ